MKKKVYSMEVVAEFEKLIASLPQRIKDAGLLTNDVCAKAEIARSTYYKRVAKKNFTPKEVRAILKIINRSQRRIVADQPSAPPLVLDPFTFTAHPPEG